MNQSIYQTGTDEGCDSVIKHTERSKEVKNIRNHLISGRNFFNQNTHLPLSRGGSYFPQDVGHHGLAFVEAILLAELYEALCSR